MLKTARQRFTYILADFLSTSIAWLAFNLLRYFTLPYNYGQMSLDTYLSMRTVILGQIAFPTLMVILYAISGYYNKVFFKSRLDGVLNACGISIIGVVIIFFSVLFNDKIDDRLGNFEIIGILWLFMSGFTILPRLIITQLTAKKIWRRQIAFNALIVGTSSKARALARDLENKQRQMGFRIKGYLSTKDGAKVDDKTYSIGDVEKAVNDLDIESFIIVPDNNDVDATIATINLLLPLDKAVYITPDTYHFITSRPRTSMVAGQVLIDVSRADIPESTVNMKRLGDIAFSSLALIALSPLFLVLAILIKLDSKGPIFYKQERIGYKKKPFKIYKFRSMSVDAEKDGPSLSTPNDPRITKLGRVLRKYRLDELPQFLNVLLGHMSIVGPRPERLYYLNQIISRAPYYNIVHQVRPGITSWGMVKYGYASNVDEMVERLKYDLLYVENVSFAVDLKILFYTVHTVITGRGI